MPRKPASKPEAELPEDEILDQDDDGTPDDDDEDDDDLSDDAGGDDEDSDDEDGGSGDEEDSLGDEDEEPAPPAIIARLKELGYDADDFEDENAALDTVFGGLSQLQQQAVLYQQQYEQLQRQMAEFQRAQQQPPPQQPAASEDRESYWPKAPVDWKSEYETMLTRDENGRIVIRPEFQGVADPNLPQRFHEYSKWQQENLQKLINDPVEATWSGYQPRVEELIQKAIEDRFGRHEQQEAIHTYLDRNKHRFYQLDEHGHVQHLPNGEEALTEEGQIYRNALYALNAQGYPKHLLADTAELLTRNAIMQRQLETKSAPKKKSPKKKLAENRDDFYRKASTRKSNTSGNRKRAIPKGKNLDLEKMLKNALKDYSDDDFED